MHAIIAAMGGKRQVTFGAAGTGTTDAAAGVAYPSGIVAGSFLVLHVHAFNLGVPTIDTPSGWTLLDSRNDGSGIKSSVFWKIAAGSESGSLAVGGDSPMLARMYRFSHGVGVESASGAYDATADTSATAVNVTTTVPKAMAVQLFGLSGSATVAAITGETGANYTEAVAEYADSSGTLSCQVATVTAATAITGGSASLGASVGSAEHGFAIKP